MEYTAKQIAGFIDGTIEGDDTVCVNQIAKIEEAQPGTITFLANPAYTQFIYKTRASIAIVSNAFIPEQPLSCTIIRVEDPYASVAKLLEIYQRHLPSKTGVSSLSFIATSSRYGENCYVGEFVYIGENVRLGINVKIYPHCYIGDNVHIGDNTTLYSGVRIYDQSIIGSHCTFHSNAVIGADGFGFAPQGENGFIKVQQIGNVIIEDHVDIGAGTYIDRATMGSTIIRKGVKLDNLIQVGHNVVIGENTVIAGQAGIAGSTKIGKNCMIGGQVGISGHLIIGDNVKIAAQSGISSNIRSGEIRMGSPAFEASKYRKSFIHFRNLDAIVKRLEQLEAEFDKRNKE
jgi:UDP-3-O-[3-hydroxymyristoyl] glucosamine N-acyltransferase